MTDKLLALVTMTVTAEVEVDIESEGVRVKLPREPWISCDASFRPLNPNGQVETTMNILEKARTMMKFAVVQRAAAITHPPEGMERQSTTQLPKEGVN